MAAARGSGAPCARVMPRVVRENVLQVAATDDQAIATDGTPLGLPQSNNRVPSDRRSYTRAPNLTETSARSRSQGELLRGCGPGHRLRPPGPGTGRAVIGRFCALASCPGSPEPLRALVAPGARGRTHLASSVPLDPPREKPSQRLHIRARPEGTYRSAHRLEQATRATRTALKPSATDALMRF